LCATTTDAERRSWTASSWDVIIDDAGKPDDLIGDGDAGILPPAIAAIDVGDHAVHVEAEPTQRKLDDPAGLHNLAGGLDIHCDAYPRVGEVPGSGRTLRQIDAVENAHVRRVHAAGSCRLDHFHFS
jgi:hypothetical protein